VRGCRVGLTYNLILVSLLLTLDLLYNDSIVLAVAVIVLIS